jgi:16S rRNA (cytidine1402-2'-O)-methyltransferase
MTKPGKALRSKASDGSPDSIGAASDSAPEPSDADAGSKPSAGLYIVATPIGNLRDITLRAIDVLRAADLIACEDTRVTARLIAAHGIHTPTTAYHDHNASRVRPGLLRRLVAGETVALVSDAGTPLISDPGYRLVRAAIDADIPVIAIPGASALLGALAVAGLPTDRFLFAGFLPSRHTARRTALESLAEVPATLVFFESPKRLAASLRAMADVLGRREATVARELTKRFEETRRGTLDFLARHYAEAGPPKGELVIVVAPPDPGPPAYDDAAVDAMLLAALEAGSVRDAATAVAARTGRPRKALYRRALALRETRPEPGQP